MISVGLHLVIVAALITSFALVVDRAQLIAPDRIQIIDIDLSAVKISGMESSLYNTNTTPDPVPENKPTPEPEPTPAPAPDAPEVEEVTTPSMIEEEPEKPKPEPEPEAEPEKQQSDAPAPKKKTVVRVNRDVVSMDRTLTLSVIDALRVAMTRCWAIDTTRPDIADIRAVAHLTMRRNGTVADVWFESASRANNDAGFAYVLDTIRKAIEVCQPLDMLPPSEFDKWQKIQLTFYPTQGKVM